MLAIPEGLTELKFQKIFMKKIMTEFKMKVTPPNCIPFVFQLLCLIMTFEFGW